MSSFASLNIAKPKTDHINPIETNSMTKIGVEISSGKTKTSESILRAINRKLSKNKAIAVEDKNKVELLTFFNCMNR